MHWDDLKQNHTPRKLRQFAGLWIVVFGGLAAWHGLAHGETRAALALAALALVIGPAGVIWPSFVRPVFIASLVLAFPIGWVVSRLVLIALFAMIIPVAIIFRLRGRDPLQLRRRIDTSTYWTPKPMPASVSSYLRQS